MPRSRLIRLMVLTGAVAFASPAAADPILECPGDNQVEIRQCLAETEARADAALAVTVGIARESAGSQDDLMGGSAAAAAFEAGQAAWEDYRDAHCGYIGSTYGGVSGTGPAITACRITHARARTAELMSALP